MIARGKFLNLEEARCAGRIDQFCKEHPSEGSMEKFDRLFEAMARGGGGPGGIGRVGSGEVQPRG